MTAKKITASLWLLMLTCFSGLFGRQLHFILVAPQQPADFIEAQVKNIAGTAGYEYHLLDYRKRTAGKNQLLADLQNLSTGTQDIVWFYYYGAGDYNDDVMEFYPYFDTGEGRVYQSAIHQALLQKKANQTLTFFDCLNEQTGCFAKEDGQLRFDKSKLQLLLQSGGDLAVSSYYKHQNSHYNASQGGLFSRAFFRSLQYITSAGSTHSPTWGEILAQTKYYLDLILFPAQAEQHPYFENNIREESFNFNGDPGYFEENYLHYGYAIPPFPFPPPRASARQLLPRYLMGNARTLGDFDSRLSNAIASCGYYEKSYYYVPQGFALVTRIEQFREDGASKAPPGRWSAEVRSMEDFSIKSYLKALFLGNKGRFRVFVFMVTSQPFALSGAEPTKSNTEEWLSEGFDRLPAKLAAMPLAPDHNCTVLIYEFEQGENGQAQFKEQSILPPQVHLEKSNILFYLQK